MATIDYLEILNKSKQLLIAKGYEFVVFAEAGEVSESPRGLNQDAINIVQEISKFIDPQIASPDFNTLLSQLIAASFSDINNMFLVLDPVLSRTNLETESENYYVKCRFLSKISFLMAAFWALIFNHQLDTLNEIKIDRNNENLKQYLLCLITDIKVANINTMQYYHAAFKLRNICSLNNEMQSCNVMESKYMFDWLNELINHEKNYEFKWWQSLSQSLNYDELKNKSHTDILELLNKEMKLRAAERDKLRLTENETKKVREEHSALVSSIIKFKNEISAICRSLEGEKEA